MGREGTRRGRYACDFCGYVGEYDATRPVDEVQCPMCGEPVTPFPTDERA